MTKSRKNANRLSKNLSIGQEKGGTAYKYVKPQKLVLKSNSQFNERWVQEKIAEDPSILGIGDLILKDKERRRKTQTTEF